MGLLAPLYALAGLAVLGPIIFHLIRRQPQGQMQFSSLMFLDPSPPRLTRRSRLDNLLLLLLRGLALLLIAAAFARPYLRQASFLNAGLDGRNIVVLMDTSASMRRPDVWKKAQDELSKLLDGVSDQDRVALYTVDDQVHAIVPIEGELSADGASSQQAVRQAAKDLVPSWRETQLANGLRTVADQLSAATIAGKISAGAESEVLLISDLQAECGLESLQGYPWPESVSLDVRRILPDEAGNARASLMESTDQEELAYRVRVENNPDSAAQSFDLAWLTKNEAVVGTPTRVQVPAGQVRVIPMTNRPSGADRVRLTGDVWQDDNDVYLVEVKPRLERIAFLGTKAARREDDLAYFLQQAPLDTELVTRTVETLDANLWKKALADPDVKTVVVEPRADLADSGEALRAFAEAGGTVIVCLARPAQDATISETLVEQVLDIEGVRVSEADTKDYALIGSVDYRHPVFSPFADPRFNDFSKIRIWAHRAVELPQDAGDRSDDAGEANGEVATGARALRVAASLDDGSPWLVHQQAGLGNVWLLTSGWQPAASGLGLSSKFVPICMGILDPTGTARSAQRTYAVGQPISFAFDDVVAVDDAGTILSEEAAEIGTESIRILEPGLYRLQGRDAGGEFTREVAIQVPESESQLLPLDTDVFEQYGIGIGKVETDEQRREAARQLQVEELEQKQRMWQWLIAAGIVVLAIETFLAGWLAKRAAQQLAAS